MSVKGPSILQYEERIRHMTALYRNTVSDDNKVLVADAIIENYEAMMKLKSKIDKLPSQSDLESFNERTKKLDEKYKTPRYWMNHGRGKTSLVNSEEPISTLNPDGKSRSCKCGARHSMFPNTHMSWCPMKEWK